MLKISKVAIAIALLNSANGLAAVTPTLTIQLSAPSPISCDEPTTLVDFKVEGTITGITNQGNPPIIEVFAVSLNSATGTGALSCPANSTGGIKLGTSFQATPQSGSQTYTTPEPLTAAQFASTTTIGSLPPCNATKTGNWGLCAFVTDQSTSTAPVGVSRLPAVLVSTTTGGGTTTTNPSIKVSGVAAGDGQVTFTVTTNTSESKFDICFVEWTDDANKDALVKELTDAKTCSGGNLKTRQLSGSTYGTSTYDSSVTLTWNELQNGTNYAFRVLGTTGKKWSDVAGPVKPEERFSTLEAFGEGTNGGLSWQCSQNRGPLTVNAALGFFGLFAGIFFLSPSRRRRLKRGIVGLALSSMILLHAVPVMAEGGSWTLGITGSPYKPNLDADKNLFPAYKCLFRDSWLPLLGLEFDFHVAEPFGTIQVGFATAYSWGNGNALVSLAPGQTNCDNLTLSDVPVALHMVQLRPRVTYAFDRYVQDVPLVPYVRLGLVGAGYYFTYQGSADSFGKEGRNPAGIRFGYEAALGLMFALDVLEPGVSSRARAGGVYNHTYLKAEIAYMPINDFGQPGLDFSNAGMFGLPSGFLGTLGLAIEFQ